MNIENLKKQIRSSNDESLYETAGLYPQEVKALEKFKDLRQKEEAAILAVVERTADPRARSFTPDQIQVIHSFADARPDTFKKLWESASSRNHSGKGFSPEQIRVINAFADYYDLPPGHEGVELFDKLWKQAEHPLAFNRVNEKWMEDTHQELVDMAHGEYRDQSVRQGLNR